MEKRQILLKEYLNQDELNQVRALEKTVQVYDETSLKLELDYKMLCAKEAKPEVGSETVNEGLYYSDNELVGYIGICSFGNSTMEISGMVHPEFRRQGIYTKLFEMVKVEAIRRGATRLLLLTDGRSISGQGFIHSIKHGYSHTEYEMFLKNSLVQKVGSVTLRKAENKDAKEIAFQDAIYFESEKSSDSEEPPRDIRLPEEEEKRGMTIFIAEDDNCIIGKVNIQIGGGIGGIYGLGVLPEYRRKGYGRQILLEAIKKIKEKNCSEVMLQVETENKNALELYTSCGFQMVSTMEYYSYML